MIQILSSSLKKEKKAQRQQASACYQDSQTEVFYFLLFRVEPSRSKAQKSRKIKQAILSILRHTIMFENVKS